VSVGTNIRLRDQQLARLRTHRSIQRYRNLLKTSPTELERQFVQKRLAEEQSNLESLATTLPDDFGGWKANRSDSRLAKAVRACWWPASLNQLQLSMMCIAR
jgi:hypothetical protein